MKKTFVTASIISAALFLSACGETTETPVDSSAEETTAPAETEQATEEITRGKQSKQQQSQLKKKLLLLRL